MLFQRPFCARLCTGLLAFKGKRHRICSRRIPRAGKIIKQCSNLKKKTRRHRLKAPLRGCARIPMARRASHTQVSLKPNVRDSSELFTRKITPYPVLSPPVGPTTVLPASRTPLSQTWLHQIFGGLPKQSPHSLRLTICQHWRL